MKKPVPIEPVLGSDPKPWSRLPGENDGAWKAFVAYRELSGERSARRVCEQLKLRIGRAYDWQKKYDWEGRAFAYDDFLDQGRILARQQANERVFAG